MKYLKLILSIFLILLCVGGLLAELETRDPFGVVLALIFGAIGVILFRGYYRNRNNNKKLKQQKSPSKQSFETQTRTTRNTSQPKKTLNAPYTIGQCVKMYEYPNNDVAMVDFANPDYSKFDVYEEVKFVPEPDNNYDSNAIKIMANNEFIGYVYRGKKQDMIHDWMKNDEPIFGAIQEVDKLNKKIKYYIAFYRDPFEVAARHENLRTKLIKTSKKIDEYTNRQDACSLLDIGDVLDLDFNAETETYIALNDMGEEVGEINKKVSETIMEKEDEFEVVCLVEEVDEDDNGKYSVNVLVYFK